MKATESPTSIVERLNGFGAFLDSLSLENN